MKTRYFQISLLAAVALLAFTAGKVDAQISTVSAQPAVAGQSAPQLSYGVPQVLQLVQAKISDSVIVNYIQSSSTIYSLSADEIVYLKQQGVSDNALNAMLNQRSRVSGYTQPAATTTSASVPASSMPATSDQSYTAGAPPVTYVQQAAQPSTVYVVPNTQTYYYSYPYYSGYYYGWPAISLSFGYYGGSYYHGCYYGGSSWHGSSSGSWHGSSGGGWHGGGSVSWHGGGGHH